MRELLDAYLFHWTPDRAIWIEGRTLSWDARCAGIYAGFAVGSLYQLAAAWRAWVVPPLRVLCAVGLFALPLFVDVLSVAFAYRMPSNDARYLTGLLFGCTLSIALLPAVMSLLAQGGGRMRGSTLAYFAPTLLGIAAVFSLKSWESLIAFAVTEALCYTGFFALSAMLALGVTLASRRALARG